MKNLGTIIGTIIGISIGIILIGITTMVYFDNQKYFNEYFEVKRTKLNLMNEHSVDSLIERISESKYVIDSLKLEIQYINKNIDELNLTFNKKITDLRVSNNNKDNIIKHQDLIITNLIKNKNNQK